MAFVIKLQSKMKHYAYKNSKQETLLYRTKNRVNITDMKTKSFRLNKRSDAVLK